MKNGLLIVCLFVFTTAILLSQVNVFPKLTGPYLGQKPPGTTPEVFAPGIVSTASHEFSCCFSPDGNEFHFTRRDPNLNETIIMYSKLFDGVWTEPDVAPFVENQFSFEPFVTPDNKKLYFQSGRVIDGGLHMYTMYVDRNEEEWSKAKDPGSPFNPDKTMHISATKDGIIYTTDISEGMGTECLGVIKKVDQGYVPLEKLGAPFNKEKLSQHPWIAPDESYMLYTVRRPGQQIVSVLCFTHKKKDGSWSEPQEINFGMNAGLPFITSDGKYLFFTGGAQIKSDIYWVDAKIIKIIEPENIGN